MQLLLIIIVTISGAFASDIQINLNSKDNTIDKILSPVWQSIPYQYEWNKKELESLGDSITTELVSGVVNLGTPGTTLADVSVGSDNRVNLNWNLNTLSADALVKVRFKFRQFGVQITHDEYFKIKAREIKNASSQLNINFNGTFQFQNVSHSGFSFDWVDVTPRDGIGNVLRYIFDNVWSKDKVDRYLRDEVNKELLAWINQGEMINDIQTSVNNQLAQMQNNPVVLSDTASDVYPSLSHFGISTESLSMAMNFKVDTDQYKVHQCAGGMLNKDDATLSTSLVEKLLNNFATYEIVEDGRIKEPILCFGFKDYDENGNPRGEEATIAALGRDIKFKYWIVPTRAPKYSYNMARNEVSLDLRVRIDIKPKGYPRLIASNNHLSARVIATYKLVLTEGEGLQLVFQNFSIPELVGQLKVKWFKILPYINISTKRVQKELEDSLNVETSQNSAFIHLIDENIFINENIEVKLNGFDLNENGYHFDFEVK